MSWNFDVVIVGAGIIGLSIAREVRRRYPSSKISILEKENSLGKHASGRNSGVLHSGIYYPPDSVKARVCAEGGRELAAYCEEHRLPIERLGKVILPVREDDDAQLELLQERARINGVGVELIDEKQLKEIEPEARSATGKALYTPDTAVVDPQSVLDHIANDLTEKGVRILFNHEVIAVSASQCVLKTRQEEIHFGYLINAAGLHADTIAKAFGLADRYTILPFKGMYFRLADPSEIQIRHLIYPVPDLRFPFLGVHFTKTVDGEIYLGPSAVPAFGRENYEGLKGLSLWDTNRILFRLFQQYFVNHQGFRMFVKEEGKKLLKRYFIRAARALVPKVRAEQVVRSKKVGIRAQLLDIRRKELVMDFVIENTGNSTHILNAVSPGFTSAFRFSCLVLDEIKAFDQ